jgi:hypothetical protein
MKLKIYLRLILATLIIAVFAPMVLAQSIGLAPAQVVQTFRPGEPFEIELATVNSGAEAVEMGVEVTDFWYDGNNEKIFSPPGTSPRSAANWIQFTPEKFDVAPGAAQKMKAVITPPSDARGGYYAALFVDSKPRLSFRKTSSGSPVYTRMRVGCLVLLQAENTEEIKLEVRNATLTPPSSSNALKLRVPIFNNGNTHVFAQPTLAILDPDHKLIAKAQGDMKRLLPGQKDELSIDWAGDLKPGQYSGVLNVSYANDGIRTQVIPFTVGEK